MCFKYRDIGIHGRLKSLFFYIFVELQRDMSFIERWIKIHLLLKKKAYNYVTFLMSCHVRLMSRLIFSYTKYGWPSA